jgi:hypothetical protein
LAAIKEVKTFVDSMDAIKGEINDTKVAWSSVCMKFGSSSCSPAGSTILSFGNEHGTSDVGAPTTTWNPDGLYADDQALLDAVNTGTNGGKIIDLSAILGGTTPDIMT